MWLYFGLFLFLFVLVFVLAFVKSNVFRVKWVKCRQAALLVVSFASVLVGSGRDMNGRTMHPPKCCTAGARGVSVIIIGNDYEQETKLHTTRSENHSAQTLDALET